MIGRRIPNVFRSLNQMTSDKYGSFTDGCWDAHHLFAWHNGLGREGHPIAKIGRTFPDELASQSRTNRNGETLRVGKRSRECQRDIGQKLSLVTKPSKASPTLPGERSKGAREPREHQPSVRESGYRIHYVIGDGILRERGIDRTILHQPDQPPCAIFERQTQE